MSKKTKKLKEEIRQLHQNIAALIENPNSIESLGVKFRYQFRKDFIKMVMYGSPNITGKVYSGRIITVPSLGIFKDNTKEE